jgi:prepilin-type N-terminal cleavage/methylation domain-containing protein
MRAAIDRRRIGFTLIELLVVIAIIGILVSLVLVASADGVRRAEERATQSLITKLETALNDRLDALLNTQPPINQTHRYLAAINALQPYGGGTAYVPVGTQAAGTTVVSANTSNSDDRRAQVIAQFDFIRAELPDVFFLNSGTKDGPTVAGSYPLNFGAAPYPAGTNTLASPNLQYTTGLAADGGSWALPLGNNYQGLPLSPVNGAGLLITANPDGTRAIPTTGMFGASFSAAGGIYKNLGYATTGYDGIDNNGNGLIDELLEGVPPGSTLQALQTQVTAQLANHTHKTARSEMLYAILTNGLSPLGSVFSPDDFTGKEVQDTDGDGLPEFIDAWGEPLQFFRWPIYYGSPNGSPGVANPVPLGTSDSQLGSSQYASPSATRQLDPLDTNQMLVAPGWWSNLANPSTTFGTFTFAPPNGNSTNQSSPGAIGFMNYFHSLVEPNFSYMGNTPGIGWDRAGRFTRREFFTKFLILSAGPDREPGVAQFNKDYAQLVDSYQITLSVSANGTYMVTFPNSQLSVEQNALTLIYVENQAAVNDPVLRLGPNSGSFYEGPDTPVLSNGLYSTATAFLANSANSDDITNHNISGISTGVR